MNRPGFRSDPFSRVPAKYPQSFRVWKWHRRMAGDGSWERVLAVLTADADASGRLDWSLSVDSTIARAHQHVTNVTRLTGGVVELQESGHRAA